MNLLNYVLLEYAKEKRKKNTVLPLGSSTYSTIDKHFGFSKTPHHFLLLGNSTNAFAILKVKVQLLIR
jgi:hypothetical protein